MSRSTPVEITAAQKRQYRDEGYFVLEGAIPDEHLKMLREECARLVTEMDTEMDRLGTDVLGITHRDNRYFISNRSPESERLPEFLFGDLMAEVCRATVGEEAYLFNEQFVVKAAERGMKFGWHQDSGYVGHDHKPYVSCWCPLDDVDEENGTVYLLPFSRAGGREVVEHTREESTNDKVGYFGEDPGVPVIAPAGSIAVFSSVAFHRSGPNNTDRMRRVYLAQYSGEVIMDAEGAASHALSEPFLADGERVAR